MCNDYSKICFEQNIFTNRDLMSNSMYLCILLLYTITYININTRKGTCTFFEFQTEHEMYLILYYRRYLSNNRYILNFFINLYIFYTIWRG